MFSTTKIPETCERREVFEIDGLMELQEGWTRFDPICLTALWLVASECLSFLALLEWDKHILQWPFQMLLWFRQTICTFWWEQDGTSSCKLLWWHNQNIWISENIYPHLIIQWAISQSLLLNYLRVYDSDAGLMWTRLSLEGLPFHTIVSSWFHLNELFILELSLHCFTSPIVSVFFCFITCMSHSSLFYISVAFCLLLYLLLSFQILF